MEAVLVQHSNGPEVCLPSPTLAAQLAAHVVDALIDEVTLCPKPGLVDLHSRGAHHDLHWLLMCCSAQALRPSFQAMAVAGGSITHVQVLRERIGLLGRQGEVAMLQATGGVNTHRGAIWALGLLVTAAAQDPYALEPLAVTQRAALLARCPDRFAPAYTGHKGESACRTYQVGGARGQAQAGFPHITTLALPALHAARARGDGENAARLNALLAIMGELDDTCVLSRGGLAALHEVRQGARAVMQAGGAACALGRQALQALDARMLALHVSPGGSADLLAATLFLDRLASHVRP